MLRDEVWVIRLICLIEFIQIPI